MGGATSGSYSVFLGLSPVYRRHICFVVVFSFVNLSFIIGMGVVSATEPRRVKEKLFLPLYITIRKFLIYVLICLWSAFILFSSV